MDLGVHLPLMEFGDEGQSLARLHAAADAARACGFGAVSGNDHFLFATPWLDCFAALAAVADRTGEMELASAYNTTPDRFAAARARLPEGFPCALATMWTWITEDRAEADRMLDGLASRVARSPEELREQVCVGSAEHCSELVSRYAEAGCQRVYFWPLGNEPRQVELVASAVRTGG